VTVLVLVSVGAFVAVAIALLAGVGAP